MDQKNSELLVKWNATDEMWEVSHSYEMGNKSIPNVDRIKVCVVRRSNGEEVLSIIGDDGCDDNTECWLDKSRAQALVTKMQELINEMKD